MNRSRVRERQGRDKAARPVVSPCSLRTEKKFAVWLSTNLIMKFNSENNEKRGRLNSSDFAECSTFTKRIKIIKIEEAYTESEIQEAFLRSLTVSDRKKISKIMDLKSSSGERENTNDCLIFYTSEEVLALMEQADLTKNQCQIIHIQASSRNANIYPPYKYVAKA